MTSGRRGPLSVGTAPATPYREVMSSLAAGRAAVIADRSLRGADFTEAHTAFVDEWLHALFARQLGDRDDLAMLAVGGYGRADLAPYSDLDVLLLHADAHDISAAAESDRIEDTIDYGEIHELVIRIGRGNSFHLIEVLAMRIAREILENYPVSRVRIRVDKETPVLDGMVDSVGVEIELERSDL